MDGDEIFYLREGIDDFGKSDKLISEELKLWVLEGSGGSCEEEEGKAKKG